MLCAAVGGRAEAQIGPVEIHARVVEFIKANAPRPLPAGDTLVSWNGSQPVLFHTASRDASGVRAGMLRGDGMLGAAEVRWERSAPTSFRVEWLTAGPAGMSTLVIGGLVESGGIRVSRSGVRDTTLAVPRIPWAVADYGMEELLLPVFDALPQSAQATIAVFRPYGAKWDTLRVTVGPEQDGWRVVKWVDDENERWTATVHGTHFLWLRRSKHSDNEKRPLETTSSRQLFDRIRPAAEPVSRP